MKHILKTLLFISVAMCLFGCGKKNELGPLLSQSKNEIILSVNNGTAIHFAGPTFHATTEENYKTFVEFCRTNNPPLDTGQSENAVLITLNDQDIFKQHLPYQVMNSKFFVAIGNPQVIGSFLFPGLGTQNGHITVTINYAANQRLQGTFSGVVYSSYYVTPPLPDSIAVNGSFDVLLPAYVDQ